MYILGVLFASILVLANVASAVLVRQEWRSLKKLQQLSYLDAVLCMMELPNQVTTYTASKTRYDDFVALHIAMTTQIHFVGQFLPYHRQILSIFEQALIIDCGYDGAQYWDWSPDSTTPTSFLESPVFDPVYGFGGNGATVNTTDLEVFAAFPIVGSTGGGCIPDGPFANKTMNLGPDFVLDGSTPHCVRRQASSIYANLELNQTVVDLTLAAPDFWHLDYYFQFNASGLGLTTHGGGHFGVGGTYGEMADMLSSPNDPLFWLHHGNLDRIWDEWQRADWATRKSDIGGPDTMWAYPYSDVNPEITSPVAYENITLEFELVYAGLSPTITVDQVMDISNMTLGSYCYE